MAQLIEVTRLQHCFFQNYDRVGLPDTLGCQRTDTFKVGILTLISGPFLWYYIRFPVEKI